MNRPPYQIVCIALATSLVVMGDALLYTVLPLHYTYLGLTAFQVGVLLSVNRWVRLVSNLVAHHFLSRGPVLEWLLLMLGIGTLCMVAYATISSFWLLLAARMTWGICFSFLRHVGIFTVMRVASGRRTMERFGWYRGLSTLGMFWGAAVGGWGYDHFGYTSILLGFIIMSFAALPLGWLSQTGQVRVVTEPLTKTPARPAGERSLWLNGFTLGLVGSGILMATLGLLLQQAIGDELSIPGGAVGVATLTGILLAGRAALDCLAAPVFGAAFDRTNFRWLESGLYLLGAGVLVLAGVKFLPWILLFAVLVVFLCTTSLSLILMTRAASVGSRTLAAFVTAYDVGSASGPLIGWNLVHFGLDVRVVIWVAAAFYLITGVGWIMRAAEPTPQLSGESSLPFTSDREPR